MVGHLSVASETLTHSLWQSRAATLLLFLANAESPLAVTAPSAYDVGEGFRTTYHCWRGALENEIHTVCCAESVHLLLPSPHALLHLACFITSCVHKVQ